MAATAWFWRPDTKNLGGIDWIKGIQITLCRKHSSAEGVDTRRKSRNVE